MSNKTKIWIAVACVAVAIIVIIVIKKRREQKEQDAFLNYVWNGTETPGTSFAPTKQSAEDLKKLGYSADEIVSIMESEAYKKGEKF